MLIVNILTQSTQRFFDKLSAIKFRKGVPLSEEHNILAEHRRKVCEQSSVFANLKICIINEK
jgi:hypothetical protein